MNKFIPILAFFIFDLGMRRTLLFLVFILIITSAISQNCTEVSYGSPALIPINDLGTGSWNGFMGGLYPNGSNTMPAAHASAGVQLAGQILPLDANGNPDLINGKIVFISIGMSNGTMEFSSFVQLGNADQNKNPKVKLVDCAEGGMTTSIISIVNMQKYGHYWDTTVFNRLIAAGVTNNQVQIIWFKEANAVGSPGPTPEVYSDSLKIQSKRIMNIIKLKFPNAKICYLASRIYAGYANTTLNPEPYSYWQGWTMKWMIEEQINNDPMLRYAGANPNSPWLCWGTYNWANGTTPRSDGLTWVCPTDFNTDGTHPSLAGRQKVANMLLNFLNHDTTACWYRVGGCQTITGIDDHQLTENILKIYPNPTIDKVSVECSEIQKSKMQIFNMIGECVIQRELNNTKSEIDVSILTKGVYIIKITGANTNFQKKLIKE